MLKIYIQLKKWAMFIYYFVSDLYFKIYNTKTFYWFKKILLDLLFRESVRFLLKTYSIDRTRNLFRFRVLTLIMKVAYYQLPTKSITFFTFRYTLTSKNCRIYQSGTPALGWISRVDNYQANSSNHIVLRWVVDLYLIISLKK